MRIVAAVFLLAGIVAAQERVDLSVVNRIKAEEFEHSKVMEHIEYLSDVYGPRLTASPEFKQAADRALKQLESYGLTNGHLEKWGPFGRSWTLQQYAVELLEPRYSLMNAAPLAWSRTPMDRSPGRHARAPRCALVRSRASRKGSGIVHREVQGQAAWQDRYDFVRGAANSRRRESAADQALHRRGSGRHRQSSRAGFPYPIRARRTAENSGRPDAASRIHGGLPESVREQMREHTKEVADKRSRFFNDEGVLALLQNDSRAHDGLVFAEAAGSYEPSKSQAPPTFVITKEHYDRLLHLVRPKQPMRVQVSLHAEQSADAKDAYNIVAEIPGSSKPDEVVMLGAHFDSWNSGTGATDNGAGSAVMMEVVRLLKTLDLKMDRTVRIALWSGEEQGLLGSRAYVKEHFGDPKTMKITSQHAKLSGYFNLDNGSGKIRGVYLQGNDAIRPLFESWLEPFRDLGVLTITIRNTGGTDHLSFDAVGLPGFQFIQDPLDYMTVTHHSNMDVSDHVLAGDLMQASAIIASVVYDAATRPEMLPRKPLPKPQPAAPAQASPKAATL